MSEEKKEITSMESAVKTLNKLKEQGSLLEAEDYVKDNKVEFEHNEKKYRVRMMTFKEKEELNTMRLKRFGQLIKDKDVLLEADLIKEYKERGIDIDDINDEIKKLDAEIINLQIQLGEAISKNSAETILKGYADNINALIEKKQTHIIHHTNLLSLSLENQLLTYVAQLVTYLTTDIFEDGEWSRAFKTYEDYLNCEDEALINMAGTRSIVLQYI